MASNFTSKNISSIGLKDVIYNLKSVPFHGTETEWNQASLNSYIPKQGEIVVYDKDNSHDYIRIKIGDGVNKVGDLKFFAGSWNDLADKSESIATTDYVDNLMLDKADAIQVKSGTIIRANNSAYTPVKGLTLFGKTTQNGTPTPDAPVALESVGDSGEINIAVGGKNLVSFAENVSTETIMNGYDRWSEEWIIPDGIKGKTITYSALLKSASSTDASSLNIWYKCSADDSLRHYGGGTSIAAGAEGISYKTIDVSEDWYSIAFGVYLHGASDDPATASRGMVEIGSVATEYEPYKAQTFSASTPNGLPGIPVESGGNYTDSNGQQWICDEKDYARGVYVQRVGRRVFDGSDNWSAFSSAYPHLFVIYNIFTTGQKTFLNTAYPYYAGKYNESMAYFMGNGAGGFAVNDIRFTTLGEFIGHLAERPLEVLYALVTPIETPLSAEEMAQYASLHTNKPNTTVYNDSGAYMEFTYYTPSTAVQMVHSPADEGKILTIDEHGCVVLKEDAASLALGETSSTAYRGDRGKIAYDHSQIKTGNPHGTTAEEIDGLGSAAFTETTDYMLAGQVIDGGTW